VFPAWVEWFRSFDGRILLQVAERKKDQFCDLARVSARQFLSVCGECSPGIDTLALGLETALVSYATIMVN